MQRPRIALPTGNPVSPFVRIDDGLTPGGFYVVQVEGRPVLYGTTAVAGGAAAELERDDAFTVPDGGFFTFCASATSAVWAASTVPQAAVESGLPRTYLKLAQTVRELT